MRSPRCIIIAGPNGAGKTTFARQFLPNEEIIHFVNAARMHGTPIYFLRNGKVVAEKP